LSRIYGLQPWDMPRLTQRELGQIIDDVESLSG
jgi:hypothetical protein